MYVERSIASDFLKRSEAYRVLALVGPRQAGKTTFLKKHAGANSSYVLFDDPDARDLFEVDVKKFEVQYVAGRDLAVLDEVQYCKDAGRNLKYLADSGHKIWLTSSSEAILGKQVLSYLVGRVSVVRLYPFSLQEFLGAGVKELTPLSLERNVWEHLTYGGYPNAVAAGDVELKKTILHDLYQTMLLKDVAQVFSIQDANSLERLAKYAATVTGSVFSYQNACNDLGLSFQTIKKYLDAMEKSYLIARVTPHYTNKLKEITKQPKLFFLDTGMRNAVLRSFPNEPDGPAFENYVYTELLKAGYSPKYWRTKTGEEVDFVIEEEGGVVPVEAKLKAQTVERSLHSFIQAHEAKKALIVTYKGAGKQVLVGECKVRFCSPNEIAKALKQ